ncbi:uncharacterized protein RJT21DRAFT_71848, partial [Scheffersomyces amazonensis]|uniref:uncharacterized protein n=1 Tax=Scheffersomyces amazonensis TaxID=1078765 RepID=UPI00315D4387
CSSAHQAAKTVCRSLLAAVRIDLSWKSDGPRNIQYGSCFISWSANATFQIDDLYNAADYCIESCGSASVSCEVRGVTLNGYSVDQCLSNRADGC